MSHFAVAVFCHADDGEELERLLAPYQENNMGDCPKEFLKFHSKEQEYRELYETDTITTGDVGVKASKLYPTFEEYMAGYLGYTKDAEKGEYGYWENPNAKWDWWRIGGRYSNWFKTKSGLLVDYCQIGELDTSLDQEKYQLAVRFWEINVEGAPLQTGENEDKFFSFFSPEYLREQYGTKEEYATSQADAVPWAFVNFDGVWCEKGKMGWWAVNDATRESRVAFREAFHKTLQAAAPTDYIVLVDCHI